MKTNSSTVAKLATVKGDGGRVAVDEETLQWMKQEVQRIGGDALAWRQRQWEGEDVRYCRWMGQSPDGRKHKEAMDGTPAFPFEGASDARIRTADMVINERVMVLAAAALRMKVKVRGLELRDEGFANRMDTVLRWVTEDQLGAKWRREVTKLANYQEGDCPGVAVMGVFWQVEQALELKRVDFASLGQILVEMGVPQEELAAMHAMVMDPTQDDMSTLWMQQVAPHLSDSRAAKVVKELRETGQSEFPSPYQRINLPAVCAFRVNEDIFFQDVGDLQRCPWIAVREWLTEVELRERVVTYGFEESWVEQVLEHEGKSAFPLAQTGLPMVTGDITGRYLRLGPEAYRNRFEVITFFFKACNEDGIPGIYTVTFHFQVEGAATDRQLLDYAHGEYPFVFFSREKLTARLMDSRGVPELLMTNQAAEKLLDDSMRDHISLTVVPPIKAPRGRARQQITVGPLKVIYEDRPGEVSYMQPPAYPQGADLYRNEIRRQRDELMGRISELVNPALTTLHMQAMVDQFLDSLGDVLMQMLQLVQQYLPDETMASILGKDGLPVAKNREAIQGKFMVRLSFDARDLNMDYLKELIGLVTEILGLDTVSVVQRDILVQRLMSAVAPDLAADAVRPLETANAAEVKDEEVNFAKIAAGVEPEMVPAGINFGLRLQTLQGIIQKNPDSVQKLDATSKEILQARLEYLQNQVQQQQNAVIGRRVGKTALGG